MAERKPPSWEEIRGVIQRVDEICRESERTRREVERAMKRRRTWPEQSPADTDEPDDGSMGNPSPGL
jgi:hypothetical protein